MIELRERRYVNNDLLYARGEYDEERDSMNMISRTTNIEQKMRKNTIDLKMEVGIDVEVGRGKNKRTERILEEITAEIIYKLVKTAVKDMGWEKRLRECSISRNIKPATDDCVAWILTNDNSTKKARALKSDRQKGWVKQIADIALREIILIYKDEAEQDGMIAFSNPRVRERMARHMEKKEAVRSSAQGGHRALKSIGMGVKDREEEDKIIKDITDTIKDLSTKLNSINLELADKNTSSDRLIELAHEKQNNLNERIDLSQKRQAILESRARMIKDKQVPMKDALDQVNRNVLEAMEKSELRVMAREDQKLLELKEMENDEDE